MLVRPLIVGELEVATPCCEDVPIEPNVSSTEPPETLFESTRLTVPPPLVIVVPTGMPTPLTSWPLKVAAPEATVTFLVPLSVPKDCAAEVGPDAIDRAPAPDFTSDSVADPEPSTVLRSRMIELIVTVF